MASSIEEEVLKEYVLEDSMKCLLCNVNAVNLPTWESHKKGKKHLKLVKRAIEEKQKEMCPSTPDTETKEELNNTKSTNAENSKDNFISGLMNLSKDDPIMSFMSGMEDVKPHVSEKYLKKQRKRREKEQKQDLKNKEAAEKQNRERDDEIAVINSKVIDMNLHVKSIAADGNCLYRAIAQQLALSDPKMASATAYKIVRRKAANYLRDHKEEFQFFLEDSVDYDMYCDKVESSNEWGGQLELRALALQYNRPIHVYSAESPVVVIGEDLGLPMFISYHTKYLSLGNHYNTLIPI